MLSILKKIKQNKMLALMILILISLLSVSLFVSLGKNQQSNTNTSKNTNTELQNKESVTDLKSLAEEELRVHDEDYKFGSDDAPIKIISYDSFSCPHCASFYNFTLKEIEERYIDTGKVQFIHRDFPLDKVSIFAARLLRCYAYSGKNPEKVIQYLYKKQSSWLGKDYKDKIINIFRVFGMSQQNAEECVEDPKLDYTYVDKNNNTSKILQITGTPTVFVNGKRNTKQNSPSVLSDMIKEQLELIDKTN